MRRALGIAVPLAFFAAVGGYVWSFDERAPSAADRQIVLANVLRALPDDARRIGARFGDAIELAAADQESTQAMPGEETKVVLYWRSLAHAAGDPRVFAHLEGPGGSRTNFDHQPVYGLYPIASWKRGEIVRDEVWVTFPDRARVGEHVLWVGLYDESTGERVSVDAAGDAIVDGEDRVRAAGWRLP